MKIRGTTLLPISHEEKFMIRSLYKSFQKKDVTDFTWKNRIKNLFKKKEKNHAKQIR